jgi:hypothetical protein
MEGAEIAMHDGAGGPPGSSETAVARGREGTSAGLVGRYRIADSGEPVPDPVLAGVVAQILPGEAGIPRWRRPSLKEARYQSDQVAGHVARKLAFSTPADPGVERSVVRYDLVPLLDRPDEVTGIPISELRAGDEVEVIGRRSVWVEVRTPNGRAGWLHRTTLEIATEDPLPSPPAERAVDLGTEDGSATGEPQPQALDQILAAIVAERRAALVAAAVTSESPDDAGGANTRPKRGVKSPRGSTTRSARRHAPG